MHVHLGKGRGYTGSDEFSFKTNKKKKEKGDQLGTIH